MLFNEGFSPSGIVLTRVDNFGCSQNQWAMTVLLYRNKQLSVQYDLTRVKKIVIILKLENYFVS